MAGDFSPLTIDVGHAGARFAPPALLVAVAIGLGTMDMPVPSIAAWEWVNWKFPRPVRAGDTIYARWTLTQKRPSVGGAPAAIVVWRVDVHTADGALCAEGEVGASVRRSQTPAQTRKPAAQPAAAAAPRRRRGRRPEAAAHAQEAAPAVAAPITPVAAAATEKTGAPRRRRRRRSRSGGAAAHNGQQGPAPALPEPVAPAAPQPVAAAVAPPTGALGRVIKRLRRS